MTKNRQAFAAAPPGKASCSPKYKRLPIIRNQKLSLQTQPNQSRS
jgi:hypothetical protein